jgi:capsular polysaccharide transport system permease protein
MQVSDRSQQRDVDAADSNFGELDWENQSGAQVQPNEPKVKVEERHRASRPKNALIAFASGLPDKIRAKSIDSQGKEKEVATALAGGGGLLFKSFTLVVLAPVLVVFLYLAFFASSVYVAEAKLIVRDALQINQSTKGSGSSIMSSLSLVGGGGDNAQNSTIVMDYIKSRAIIGDLGGEAKLAALYSRYSIDMLSRLAPNSDIENMWTYWQDHVTASVDSLSGILTLRVRAYDADDAFSLSTEIVTKSEALVNSISDRVKSDALQRASSEVNRAAEQLADARAALLRLQEATQTIDPAESAKQALKLISGLTLEKTGIENELATTASLGVANKPGESQLRARLSAINAQIEKLNSSLTGTAGATTISSQLRDFELVTIQNEFAEYIYKLARNGYERARQKADQQDLYLAVVVPPTLPNSATYPRVFSSTALTFAGLTIAWAIASLLVASIRDSIGR